MRIVFVDGFKIRNTLDDNFTSYHEHGEKIATFYLKWYIPEGEFWVDHVLRDEVDLFLKLKDFSAPQAKNYAEEREIMKKTFCLPGPAPEFKLRKNINGAQKTGEDIQHSNILQNVGMLLNTELRDTNIVYVNGKIVRQYLDPEFAIGGHKFVYDYVPENEIWIDEKVNPQEIPYYIIHEGKERELMSQGMNYDAAHDIATAVERSARRKDGFGKYPGDIDYPWYGMANEEIIKQYVVSRM